VVFELFSLEYQAHHGSGNSFLVLYATFDDLYGIVLVTTQRDGFAVESPYEDRVGAISVGRPECRELFIERCWARSVWDDLDLDSTCSLDSGYLSLDRVSTAKGRRNELADRAVGICDTVEPSLARDHNVIL
jgi:hypothetical protein